MRLPLKISLFITFYLVKQMSNSLKDTDISSLFSLNAIHTSELLSFGCRDVCLLLTVMELDGSSLVVLKAQKKTTQQQFLCSAIMTQYLDISLRSFQVAFAESFHHNYFHWWEGQSNWQGTQEMLICKTNRTSLTPSGLLSATVTSRWHMFTPCCQWEQVHFWLMFSWRDFHPSKAAF